MYFIEQKTGRVSRGEGRLDEVGKLAESGARKRENERLGDAVLAESVRLRGSGCEMPDEQKFYLDGNMHLQVSTGDENIDKLKPWYWVRERSVVR